MSTMAEDIAAALRRMAERLDFGMTKPELDHAAEELERIAEALRKDINPALHIPMEPPPAA